MFAGPNRAFEGPSLLWLAFSGLGAEATHMPPKGPLLVIAGLPQRQFERRSAGLATWRP